MDAYESYVSDLPRPTTETEKDLLKNAGKAFVVGDNIVNRVHKLCNTPTPTRVLEVYVPEVEETIPLPYPHHGARKPNKECRKAFKKMWEEGGANKKTIKEYEATAYKGEDSLRNMDPQERLIQDARLYKTNKGIQSVMDCHEGLLEILNE